MGTDRKPPSSISSEESLLGAMLLSQEAVEKAGRILTPDDFYKPANAQIFMAMLMAHAAGEKSDPVVVATRLSEMGVLADIGGPAQLINLQAGTPATSNASKYAETILKYSLYRKAINLGHELAERCYELDGDPSDIMDWARDQLAMSGVRIGDTPDDVYMLDDFLDRPDAERPDWCIEGLLRVGWRALIVAGEGVGKTYLLRQFAIAAAQGIHPMNFSRIAPCRALIIDLENPDESVMDTCNPIREKALGEVGDDYDPDRAWLWHRPSGINIRNRADRVTMEAVIAHVRPTLVCVGPLYKMYEVGPRDNDEQAAREVMAVLDDLRSRYKFGLLMEHHAPKESGGGTRKMMPYGSSLWLRWPELGLSLNPESSEEGNFDVMKIGRWRGDRLDNQWPDRIHRGGKWPWEGEYNVDPKTMGRGPSTSLSGLEPEDDYIPPTYHYRDDDEDDDEFPSGSPF